MNIQVWDIQAVKRQLEAEVCNHILFLHSILGCDTTSRLHGLGKGNALKKFREQRRSVELDRVFDSQLSLKEDVIAAGEEALIILYNGKVERNLDSLRYKIYCDKVVSSSCYVHPQTLPPTSSAAKYHSVCVYYQIRQWQGTEVASSSCYVHPQTLPPTSSAAKYHSVCVYYQIRQWQGTEVASSSCYLHPQTIPPTSSAAKYHSLCVYY